jgi:hypothetical protein
MKGGVPLFSGARLAWPKKPGTPTVGLPMHARRPAHSSLAAARRPSRRDGRRVLSAGVAQLAEHLFCKQVVGGSSPPASSIVILGGLPERPKGAGCKPAGIAYVGSNPTPSTDLSAFSQGPDASPRRRRGRSGQVFVSVSAGSDASRLRRPMAARCRVRRFVVGVLASAADRDLVFQDLQGDPRSAGASRVTEHSLPLLGEENGRRSERPDLLETNARVIPCGGAGALESQGAAGRLARPGRSERSDGSELSGRTERCGRCMRRGSSFIAGALGCGSAGRMGAVGVFVGVAGVVAGMGHNRRLARGGGSSGLPLRVPRGSSSIGRASAFQAERRGFESLLPLYSAPTARRIGWPT